MKDEILERAVNDMRLRIEALLSPEETVVFRRTIRRTLDGADTDQRRAWFQHRASSTTLDPAAEADPDLPRGAVLTPIMSGRRYAPGHVLQPGETDDDH